MELGPLQTLWIKELKEHPERQMDGRLGIHIADNFRACCLGQGLVCLKGKEAFSETGYIRDVDEDGTEGFFILQGSFEQLGLRDASGTFKNYADINGKSYYSLTSMNDEHLSWKDIACYMEANPDNVFTKSV